jgi:hypothetical protein
VQHVAEAHGGRVTVRSQIGAGSEFTIWLPLHADQPLPPIDDGPGPAADLARTTSPQQWYTGQGEQVRS